MYNTNPFTKRNNGVSFPSSFADLDAQFESLISALPSLFDLGASGATSAASQGVKARWYEKEDAFMAQLDLPGVKAEDIEVEWKDDAVRVTAVLRLPDAESGQKNGQSDHRYNATLGVPDHVDAAQIAAAYEHGVLSLTFPKVEKVQPRRIEVKSG